MKTTVLVPSSSRGRWTDFKRVGRTIGAASLLSATLWAMVSPSAWAVPSYSRQFGVECSTCHSMWGSLNPAGVQFRLSGYRAIAGRDLKPVSPDIEISKGVTIPLTLPLSFVTGVGIDGRHEKREVGGASATSSGTSLSLEDASIFMTSALGQHLSVFAEFPMYETKAWEFTPTGNFEARFNTTPPKNVKFATEKPTFEVAKFWWNNLLGDSAPRDSVNLLAGITHLPTAYAAGKVRLSVNQYLIYERTALDLISPRNVAGVLGVADPNDALFRLSEPQVMAEVNGMLTFGKPIAEVAKRETFWGEYHLGMTNGSNAAAANRAQKDLYGRWVMRWYNQSLGLFGFRSGDLYGDDLRTTASAGTNLAGGTGIMSGSQGVNKVTRVGPDMTLSLAPYAIPLSLENQVMYNSESNPTGFGQEFKWKGGFHQLNYQYSRTNIAYARYDWIKGDGFNDTNRTVNGVTGITMSTPKEHDYVLGWQHLVEQNIKLVAEFRRHVFDDTASSPAVIPTLGVATRAARLSDNGFTLRVMFGF